MARIKVEITGKPQTKLSIPVRITDLNYGNHLGNDSLVSLLHEARVQWLQKHGYTELNMGGAALIMAGLSVEYVSESFYGDTLVVQIFSGSVTDAGFELYYDVRCERNGKELVVCRAKTDMVCFDYEKKKVRALPPEVRLLLS